MPREQLATPPTPTTEAMTDPAAVAGWPGGWDGGGGGSRREGFKGFVGDGFLQKNRVGRTADPAPGRIEDF